MRFKYFYGYNIVAAGFIIQAVCIGAMFTYGLFFREFIITFGWSRTVISGASSAAFAIMGLLGILAGRLNDAIGPRRIIIFSSVVFGLGYMLMSRLQAPWQLYLAYGGMVSVGFATHDVITLSTVARWFTKRRGAMSGVVKVGTGVGQLFVPLLVAALMEASGWRTAYVIMGAASIVILVPVAGLMRSDPQSMGLCPDGSLSEADRNPPAASFDQPLRSLILTRTFITLCLAQFLIFFCLVTIVVHIVPHATDLGLSATAAAALIGSIGGVSMLGRIVIGTASDRIGGRPAMAYCLAILIVSLLLLIGANTAWMLYLFAVIYGFAHGGVFTVVSPLVAERFGLHAHGILFGIILFCGTTGGAFGPLLAGWVFDQTGSYRTFFGVLTGFVFLALILIMQLPPSKPDAAPS